ncbi:uncharacterized protein LOC142977260 [Anticarsia gemmatalis]|uniref:uncharacterized protein LOC142977260 n=1 Tax=Anticarsia gemmatalis TaxID=129554 RepID=UPI003F768B92
MLRYFYILLLCIEWTFSYNYINYNGRRTHKRHVGKLRNKDRRDLSIGYDYDRSPVEFDLASFIQPEEDNIEDNDVFRYRTKKRRRVSKNYDYANLMGGSNHESFKRKTYDYLNPDSGEHAADFNLNPMLYKDAVNAKHYDMNNYDNLNPKDSYEKYRNLYKDQDILMPGQVIHNQEKKCAFKKLKFPFFSHNKSETLKPKNKKRKLFCFACPKKEKASDPDINGMPEDSILHYKMKKRSLEERLCPVCKRRFIANLKSQDRRKKNPKNIIHNSRQFFQKRGEKKEAKDLKKLKQLEESEKVAEDRLRRKRQENERERQLKELEEVQAKINNVRVGVGVPKMTKPEPEPQ